MYKRTTTTVACLAVLISMLAADNAPAAYVQNFDGLTLGTINNQDGWFSGANDVVQNTTVVSGQALTVTQSTTGRTTIFDTIGTAPIQKLSFDLRLGSDINDFIGMANVDIQHTMLFRGPAVDKQFAFVYKAVTNGTGAVVLNNLEFRGATTSGSPNSVLKNTWYHVEMELNFVANTLDGLITELNGPTFFDPAVQNGFQPNGNVNVLSIDADGDPDVNLFIDNFSVVAVPEPAGLTALSVAAFGFLAAATRRRRRVSA